MVVGSSRMAADDAALSVSMSPLLPSSIEEEADSVRSITNGGKRVHFQPTHTVFTPRLTETSSLRYRKPDDRVVGSTSLAPPTSVSSIAQPNYDDFLRRVSVVLYQHLRRCEKRHREEQRAAAAASAAAADASGSTASGSHSAGLPADRSSYFLSSSVSRQNEPPALQLLSRAPTAAQRADNDLTAADDTVDYPAPAPKSNPSISSPRFVELPVDEIFREEHFVTPQYKYTFIRLPRVFPMTSFVMEKVSSKRHVPSVDEIFRFCKNLFNKAQLSAECTIVCLIYIERLMEQANIPLLAVTWKPIVLCGLLLASKVRDVLRCSCRILCYGYSPFAVVVILPNE